MAGRHVSSITSAVVYAATGLLTAGILLLSLTFIFIQPPPSTVAPTFKITLSAAQMMMADRATNETLGFGGIYVISLPTATDKRESLQQVANVSGIQLKWVDGVLTSDVPPDSLPPGTGPGEEEHNTSLEGYAIGAYVAHMHALKEIIESGVETAVIAEDDIDWDINVKSLMRKTAIAMQTLTQPPIEGGLPHVMEYDDLPAVRPPITSPYGDGWEVLWLGDCRMEVDDSSYIVDHDDVTVVAPKHLHSNQFPGNDIRWDLPPHTRIYHRAREGLCTLFYAITRETAIKMYHQMNEVLVDGPMDVMLFRYCNPGGRPAPGDKTRLMCMSVTPQLFNHWRGERSENIRYSARVNIDRLRSGAIDYVDSFPDRR